MYNFINQDNTFFFWKGRVALYAILKSCGIQNEDLVILPGYTCIVVSNAIIYCGAKPLYVDIAPKNYNISIEKLKNVLEKISPDELKKIKAIIVQHTYGIPAEIDEIIEIARKYNLWVIEDCAHCFASKYKGKMLGAFGDAAFFSFQWQKPVTSGLGGVAVINNKNLTTAMKKIYSSFTEPTFKEVIRLRLEYIIYKKILTPKLFWIGINLYRKLSVLGILTGSSSNEEIEGLKPANFERKMSKWQLKVLKDEFAKINKNISHRKKIVQYYEKNLQKLNLATLNLPEYMDCVLLRYPLLVKDKQYVLEEAKKEKVEIGEWFLSPLHPNLSGWEKEYYVKGSCPQAEDTCKHIINLPTHLKINKKETDKIINFLKKLIF